MQSNYEKKYKNLNMSMIFILVVISTVWSQNEPFNKVQSNSLTNESRAVLIKSFNTGNNLSVVGRIMAWGGLGLAITGPLMKNTKLYTTGSIMYFVGIPLNGVGAVKTGSAGEKLDPSFKDYGGGWIWWATGTLFGLWSTASISNANKEFAAGNHENAKSELAAGSLIATIGTICNIVAWNKFSNRVKAANSCIPKRLITQHYIKPVLFSTGDGAITPGLQYSMAF